MSAQTGSSEVSKKLKAAIRAKLEELGVYVDDELPDYIMVMIANKKEKSQMKEDLGLFIGKNTAKFVDWLFDLFDRLQSASTKQTNEKAASSSTASKSDDDYKKEEKRQKEAERQKQEERDRLDKEEREKEKEKERERQREKDRSARSERDRKKHEEKSKRRRSRSNTYSDEEELKRSRKNSDRSKNEHKKHEPRSVERRRVASTVVSRKQSTSPEPQRVHSTVTVKRHPRPVGDNANAKARSNMFLRAMNDASVSAGYASTLKTKSKEEKEYAEDDMSDVEALPTKAAMPRQGLKNRLQYIDEESRRERIYPMEDDAVVLNNKTSEGGPKVIVKLAGGKEAIQKLKIHERIVIMDKGDQPSKRSTLKRKQRDDTEDEPKSKHDRIIFDLTPPPQEEMASESPTLKKWNGRIQLNEESETSDEEAEIDALLAETQGYGARLPDDEELPPTHQLSGGNYTIHVNPQYQSSTPSYIPTPINVLQEQQNQSVDKTKANGAKERCIFWPKCTKGEACQFFHPVKSCTNFPNCSFGNRCLFIHPACRFDKFCTKKLCTFTHYGTGGTQPQSTIASSLPLTSNRPTAYVAPQIKSTATTSATVAEGAAASSSSSSATLVTGSLSSIAAKLTASLGAKKKAVAAEKSAEPVSAEPKAVETLKGDGDSENVKKVEETKPATEVGQLQNLIPCRYAGGCRNPGCYFKHPKECKFGTNCKNASCYFYHKPTPVQPTETSAKYKWTATA